MPHEHDHQHDHADHHAHAHGDGHSHASDHAHSHASGHAHAHGSTNETRLAWALFVIALFMIVEVVGGLISGSLALIADAAHMASDVVALGMSWMALRIGRRPPNARLSYGYRRLEVLVAFVNGLTLLVISAGVIIEAVRRFAEPQAILGSTMFFVAVSGLLSNIVAFVILHGGSRENLNMRSAWLHVLGDLVSSVVAIIAALVIMWTGFSPIDPILSILVSLLIAKSAWSVTRSAATILLEASPPGVDPDAVRQDLLSNVPGLADVHHVHAWCLTAESAMVTLHARAAPGTDPLQLPPTISARLREKFRIAHATVQMEPDACADDVMADLPPPVHADHGEGHGHGHGHDHGHHHGHGSAQPLADPLPCSTGQRP
jgi:cobalt-zinc-cadmium efflux system protein